jgi:hypothetical protein
MDGQPSRRRMALGNEAKRIRGCGGVAGPLKIYFLNIEGLRNKLGDNDFLALLAAHDIFGIAGSWAGFEKFDVRGYTGYVKGRGRIASVETQEA